MDSKRPTSFLLALLALLALAAAAATVDSPTRVADLPTVTPERYQTTITPTPPGPAANETGGCFWKFLGLGCAWGLGAFLDPRTLLVLVAVVVVMAVLAVRRATVSDADFGDLEVRDEAADQPGEREPDVTAVGRSAGRAADRIEDASATENEIYRAWREMVRHLEVGNPDTTTPAEFAHAATDVGMEAAAVDELTEVFRLVRYGEEAVTPERERRAVSALRRIERAYGDEDAGSADGGREGDEP